MTKRLKNLWNFIDEYLEVDYGYLPKLRIDDKDDSRVDEYIQEIRDDFKEMRENALMIEESIQDNIKLLKGLDDI